MRKFLSVVLAFLMLAVMLPVTAMADEALPTAPTMNGNEWTVTTENIQATLDGAYGSIDGKTIILSAGTYGPLELGRATKYAESHTRYFICEGNNTSTLTEYSFENFHALKNNGQFSYIPMYFRSMSNVTFKAATGATVEVAGVYASSGHKYSTPHDYVLDTDTAYYLANQFSNITFDGITFTAKSDINTSIPQTTINGITFRNCTFNINNTASGNQAIRYYNENNNGNLTDLTVENCEFNNCFQGVLATNTKNVTVKDCTFDTTGHNAIAVQDFPDAYNHGDVVITGNTFKNVGDRIIRFNNVGEGTDITISKNTSINSGDSNGEIIKGTLPEGMEVTMTNNNWGKVGEKDPVIGTGFVETTPSTIVIITPTEDTPKTDDQKNPATGANDMVAAAVALMAVSALGMAVLARKK